jgi:hypothetical protein
VPLTPLPPVLRRALAVAPRAQGAFATMGPSVLDLAPSPAKDSAARRRPAPPAAGAEPAEAGAAEAGAGAAAVSGAPATPERNVLGAQKAGDAAAGGGAVTESPAGEGAAGEAGSAAPPGSARSASSWLSETIESMRSRVL